MLSGKNSCQIAISCLECFEESIKYSETYEYKSELTPRIIATSPTRGPSKGGFEVVFELENRIDSKYEIENINCTDTKMDEKIISCSVGQHQAFPTAPPQVRFSSYGFAARESDFELIDLWSDESTWGCNSGQG